MCVLAISLEYAPILDTLFSIELKEATKRAGSREIDQHHVTHKRTDVGLLLPSIFKVCVVLKLWFLLVFLLLLLLCFVLTLLPTCCSHVTRRLWPCLDRTMPAAPLCFWNGHQLLSTARKAMSASKTFVSNTPHAPQLLPRVTLLHRSSDKKATRKQHTTSKQASAHKRSWLALPFTESVTSHSHMAPARQVCVSVSVSVSVCLSVCVCVSVYLCVSVSVCVCSLLTLSCFAVVVYARAEPDVCASSEAMMWVPFQPTPSLVPTLLPSLTYTLTHSHTHSLTHSLMHAVGTG